MSCTCIFAHSLEQSFWKQNCQAKGHVTQYLRQVTPDPPAQSGLRSAPLPRRTRTTEGRPEAAPAGLSPRLPWALPSWPVWGCWSHSLLSPSHRGSLGTPVSLLLCQRTHFVSGKVACGHFSSAHKEPKSPA